MTILQGSPLGATNAPHNPTGSVRIGDQNFTQNRYAKSSPSPPPPFVFINITHTRHLPAHTNLKMAGDHAFMTKSVTIESIPNLTSLDACVQGIIMQYVRGLRKIARIHRNIHLRLSIFDFRQQDLIDFESTATTQHATRQEVLHNFMQLMLYEWQRECMEIHDTRHSRLYKLMENIMHLLFSRLIHTCTPHYATAERHHETFTNSQNIKTILAMRDATAVKIHKIDQFIESNLNTIRTTCQISGSQDTNTTAKKYHNRIESLAYFHNYICARDKWQLVAMPAAPLFVV